MREPAATPERARGQRPVEVTCPACGEASKPLSVEHPQGAGLILAMRCPLCGHETPFARLSAKGVALRARFQDALARWRSAREPRHYQQVERLQRAYKRELHRIRKEASA